MNRVCDKCKRPPAQWLRRLSVEYADGTSITIRLCEGCYRWSTRTLREALFGKTAA